MKKLRNSLTFYIKNISPLNDKQQYRKMLSGNFDGCQN